MVDPDQPLDPLAGGVEGLDGERPVSCRCRRAGGDGAEDRGATPGGDGVSHRPSRLGVGAEHDQAHPADAQAPQPLEDPLVAGSTVDAKHHRRFVPPHLGAPGH